MAITNAMCTSFKVALFNAEMDFSADTVQVFKIALYTDLSNINAATTAYTTLNEVVDGGGYSAGGIVLTIATNPTSSGVVAFLDFDNPVWPTSNITAAGALIYTTTAGTPSVATLDFNGNKTTSGGDYVLNIPTANATTAILRLG